MTWEVEEERMGERMESRKRLGRRMGTTYYPLPPPHTHIPTPPRHLEHLNKKPMLHPDHNSQANNESIHAKQGYLIHTAS